MSLLLSSLLMDMLVTEHELEAGEERELPELHELAVFPCRVLVRLLAKTRVNLRSSLSWPVLFGRLLGRSRRIGGLGG